MAVALSVSARPARAATTPVDCTADPGALAGALATAGPGDTLGISGTCVGSYVISQEVTLKGSGDATIHGPGGLRVLLVRPGANVTIDGLTITGGDGFFAGTGILNAGSMRIRNSTVSGNSTTSWG